MRELDCQSGFRLDQQNEETETEENKRWSKREFHSNECFAQNILQALLEQKYFTAGWCWNAYQKSKLSVITRLI